MHRRSLVTLLAPLLAVAACAQPADEGAQPLETGSAASIDAARVASADADTGRTEMKIEVIGVGDRPSIITATGAFDRPAEGGASVELDLGAMLDGEPVRLVVDEDTIYLSSSFLPDGVGEGWISASTDALAAVSGGFVDQTTEDPTSVLEVLRGVSDDVTTVGTDEVRGEPTTHYAADVDLQAAVSDAPADERGALQAHVADLFGSVDVIPVEVWIDDDGRVRRLEVHLDAEGVETALTLELFDYGQAVDIEVPAPDEVHPAGDLLEGWFGGFAEAGS